MACQQNGNQLPRDIPNKSGSWKTSWHRKPLQLKSLWERFVSTHWKVHTCIVFLMYFDDHFFTALLWNLRGTTFWLLMLTIINAQIRVIFISSELYDPWWQIEYITLRNLTFRFFFFHRSLCRFGSCRGYLYTHHCCVPDSIFTKYRKFTPFTTFGHIFHFYFPEN